MDSIAQSVNAGFQMAHQMAQQKQLMEVRRQQAEAQRLQQELHRTQMLQALHSLAKQQADEQRAERERIERDTYFGDEGPGRSALIKMHGEDQGKLAADFLRRGGKPSELQYLIPKPKEEKEQPIRFSPIAPGSGVVNSTTGEITPGLPAQTKDDSPAEVKEFEAYSGLGKEKRGTPEYRKAYVDYLVVKRPKGESGRTPSGYRYTQAGDLEPIPGGPADVKYQQQYSSDLARVGSLTEALNKVEQAAATLKKNKGLGRIFGIPGVIPNIPGLAGADAQAKLENLKSQTGFTALQAMRDASKTGGALGQVSDMENKLLQTAIANLDKAQSVESAQEALDTIISYTQRAKDNINNAFTVKYNEAGQPRSNSQSSKKSGNTKTTSGKYRIIQVR